MKTLSYFQYDDEGDKSTHVLFNVEDDDAQDALNEVNKFNKDLDDWHERRKVARTTAGLEFPRPTKEENMALLNEEQLLLIEEYNRNFKNGKPIETEKCGDEFVLVTWSNNEQKLYVEARQSIEQLRDERNNQRNNRIDELCPAFDVAKYNPMIQEAFEQRHYLPDVFIADCIVYKPMK